MPYFQKEIPTTPVRLNNGTSLKFEDVDGRIGVHKTNNEFVVGELRQAIAAGRGGVSEISESEFLDLLKKKQPQQLKWRDEIKAGYARDSLAPPAAAAVVAASPAAGSPEVAQKPLAQPLTVADAPKQKTGKFKVKVK